MKYMSMDIVGMLDTYLHSDGSWVCVRVAKTKELQHPPHYLSGLSRSSRTYPVARHRMQKIIAESTCHVERWHRTCRGSAFAMAIAIWPCLRQLVWESFVCIGLLIEKVPPAVALCDVLLASTIHGEPRMIVKARLGSGRCRRALLSLDAVSLALKTLLHSTFVSRLMVALDAIVSCRLHII